MPVHERLPEGLGEVDVIICGGGLTACVVAGRLAEASPELSILMIEGGDNNATTAISQHPAPFPLNLLPTSRNAVLYQAKKSEKLAGRVSQLLTGGILGGGSSINIMLYSRPVYGDFDSFNTPGWSTEDMLPYLKRLETYHGDGDSKAHGHDGRVHVTKGAFRGVRSQDDFLEAAEQLGHPVVTDLHDTTPGRLGFERAHKTVTVEGGRMDAATAYVHPLLTDGEHPNLHVLCGNKVGRVLFDENKRAVGVEYSPTLRGETNGINGNHTPLTIKSKNLTVVSCGALGSPLVLQRSGVGSQEILEKSSVLVVVDLPGVGMTYQDHNLIVWPFRTDLALDETLDGIWSGRMAMEEAASKGMLGWNACDTHGKIRPSEEDVDALGPDFRQAWDRDYKDNPSKPLVLIASAVGVYITGPGVDDPPDFDTGFMTSRNDVKQHLRAYKAIREIVRRTHMYRGELKSQQPQFPAGSEAATADLSTSLVDQGPVKDLQYTKEDDKAIEQAIREQVTTTWHSLGTCPMKPREQGGVVDQDLNVHGVSGLKVIDLSIPPENVGANTQITAYTIGEKGADIILKELGLLK